MPKKRRWSVQEAEQQQLTGQATLIFEDSYVCKLVNKLCYYELFIAAKFLQILEEWSRVLKYNPQMGVKKLSLT